MLRLESLNDLEWRRLIERLDMSVAEASREYLRDLYARRVSIQSSQLGPRARRAATG